MIEERTVWETWWLNTLENIIGISHSTQVSLDVLGYLFKLSQSARLCFSSATFSCLDSGRNWAEILTKLGLKFFYMNMTER